MTTPTQPHPSPDLANLDLSPQQMEALGRLVLERVIAHQAAVGSAPSRGDVQAEDLCRQLRQDQPPEDGQALEPLLDAFFDEWVPRSFNTISPGYLAFVPGGGLFASVLAGLMAEGTNRFTGIFRAAPALVQLEANVLRWMVNWMGYPDGARGLLTTGGSLANLAAIICAREHKLGERLRDGVIYVSTQAHHCVAKSARLAGVLPDRLRLIPVDKGYALRIDALEDAIAADRVRGLVPFLVVSSAGTTNTGAVDPLQRITDVCRREGLWHHCDGAYGATFHMCPELRGVLAGLPETDSLTLDPHKGLFLPYGVGALLVRNGEHLRAAHAATAGYLPALADDEFYDPAQYGPELSRDYRGLRVWLPLQLHGARAYRAALLEKHQLALAAALRVADIPGVVMDCPPALSLFAFHLTRPGASLEDENRLTSALMEATTARGRVMLSGAQVGPRFLGRVCVLSFRTRAVSMDQCVEDLAASAAQLLASEPGN